MAVAYETSMAPHAVTFDAAGETETVAFDAGTGSNRVLLVFTGFEDATNDITGVTYNGVAMTSAGAKQTAGAGAAAGRLYYLANPASGSNDIAVTSSATGGGNPPGMICAWVGNGCDVGGTPVDGYTAANGTTSSANLVTDPGDVTSASGDRVVIFNFTRNVTANISVTTSTNYTERQDANNGSGFTAQYGDGNGAATLDVNATWDNGAFTVTWVSLAINVNQASGGSLVPVFLHHLRQQGIA